MRRRTEQRFQPGRKAPHRRCHEFSALPIGALDQLFNRGTAREKFTLEFLSRLECQCDRGVGVRQRNLAPVFGL